jgi:hypothetical protein
LSRVRVFGPARLAACRSWLVTPIIETPGELVEFESGATARNGASVIEHPFLIQLSTRGFEHNLLSKSSD